MEQQELNCLIKKYLEEDKTKSAIMLTAEWGTGKSYYILNSLIPFLKKESGKNGIVVSLYGLSNITEVNRSLYFEIRLNSMKFKKIKLKKEWSTSAFMIGKTVFKGLTSHFGIDISLTDKDLNKLYTSVDFKKNLIIFEDLERTNINLIEFLGYVNSLVEQDGIKVLLVTNEIEFLQFQTAEGKPVILSPSEKANYHSYKSIQDSADRKPGFELSEFSGQYLRIKEKTISDTLIFTGDKREAIKNILSLFSNCHLLNYTNKDSIVEIIKVFDKMNQNNLRSFLFACQKTRDIYSKIQLEYNEDFIKSIFFGIVYFVMKQRQGDPLIWNEKNEISYELGSTEYPLFKFCYNYIIYHKFESQEVVEAINQFEEAKLYDTTKSNNDCDLNIIYSYYVKTEQEIKNAIINIENKLHDIDIISFYNYGTLANYLICITQHLDCDICGCLELIINNLKGKGDKIDKNHLFRSSIEIEDSNKKTEWENVKNKIIISLNPPERRLFDFDYSPESISEFNERTYKNHGRILNERSFMKRLDIKNFAALVFACSSREIDSIREMLGTIYSSAGIKEYLSEDKESLCEFKKLIAEHEIPAGFDRIQVLQKDYLISNLDKYIDYLS